MQLCNIFFIFIPVGHVGPLESWFKNSQLAKPLFYTIVVLDLSANDFHVLATKRNVGIANLKFCSQSAARTQMASREGKQNLVEM